MAFKSDYEAKRTLDSETGWELFDVTQGPDFPHFELRHPEQRTISFWCKTLSRERVDGVTARGGPRYRQSKRVTVMSSEAVSAGEMMLIQQALEAFGFLHDGPIGPIELTFEK